MAYLQDGREVEVINSIEGKYIVCDIYEDGELGNEYVVSKIYEKPPSLRYCDEIKKLDKIIGDKNQELSNLKQDIFDLKKEGEKAKKEIEDVIKLNDSLKHLKDFLTGKITHYLFADYSYKIMSFDETSPDERYSKHPTRLLTLFGQSNGDLNWKLNRWSDGSGGYETVYPCLSYEEAVEKAKSLINFDRLNSSTIDFCLEHGIEIPIESANKYLQELKESIEKAKQQDNNRNLKNEQEYKNLELKLKGEPHDN